MARRKEFYPILIVYFEEYVLNFLKRISLYFMNARFEWMAKLKLTNFGQIAKIGIQMGSKKINQHHIVRQNFMDNPKRKTVFHLEISG